MNRKAALFLASFLVMGFGLASCTAVPAPEDNSGKEEQKPDPDPQDPTDPTGPQAGIYKFIASSFKGKWEAGDQIYVRANLGYNAQIITLTQADISEDGKTASAALDKNTVESPAEPDGLYAAWPAEAVQPYNGIAKTKNTFKDTEVPLAAAYLEGDTFRFLDISSALSFKVSGDFDKWAICAKDRSGICITRFECDYSSKKKAFNYKQNDGYPFRYGTMESGAAKIWFPGDFDFPKGFTLYFGKGDSWTAYRMFDKAQKLTSGQTLDLGDLTASLVPYEGPAPRMPRKVASKKYTVSFNELSGIRISEDGTFLWGVGDDGDLAKIDLNGKVLSSFHIGGDSEDVSINPETHDLLIGLEPDGVGVVKAPNYNSRASTLFSVAACGSYGNSGIEGLTYYKDGMVFAGAQANSHLFLCDLATKKVLWSTMMYDVNRVSEIAGLSYDPLTGWLWIVDSEAKKVFVFEVDHTVTDGNYNVSMDYIGAYPVDGSNPESVCVDRLNNCVWVGDDYGSTSYLYRYEFTGLDEFDLK